MKDISRKLFALFRFILCGEEPIAFTLTNEEAKAIYLLAKKHDLCHIIAEAIGKLNLPLDEGIKAAFDKQKLTAIYRGATRDEEYTKICSLFEDESIPYISLKGSVIKDFYPESWMRTSCDIDILVRDEDMKRALDALIATLDYKTDNNRHYHDMSLYSPGGIHLELHFNIKENMYNIDALLSKAWEYSRSEKSDGFRYELTSEFFVFHHVAHMSYHFINGGCGIKPFADLFIIKNKMQYDNSVVKSYCRQCGIEKFYDNVSDVADTWFGDGAYTPILQSIENYILEGGVYGTLKNKLIIEQSKRGGKINYVLSRLFMPYKSLKNYYPVLEKHKWLFPLMQIRRWCVLIKGKLKRKIRGVKVNQSIEKSQVGEMGVFLKEVGL